MAIEHASLTGNQLHEPKGADSAAAGTVYVADGAGSGDWEDPLENIHNQNVAILSRRFDDLAAAGSIYFHVPHKAQIDKLHVVLYGTIDANTVLTIYINGVLFADSLTIVAAGSAAGQVKTLTTTTPHTVTANSVVTITSDGAATASVRGEVQLELEAIA